METGVVDDVLETYWMLCGMKVGGPATLMLSVTSGPAWAGPQGVARGYCTVEVMSCCPQRMAEPVAVKVIFLSLALVILLPPIAAGEGKSSV